MAKYITELLDALNKNPELIKTPEYKDNFSLKTIAQYSYNPELKFKLPAGAPPYKPDAAPIGMSPANFYQQVKKLYIFTRTDITNVRREQLFIQLIEGLHPSEAEVCIAVKDQNLTSLYPNLTNKLFADAGWVPLVEVAAKTDSKSEGKSLVLNLSDSATTKESFGPPPAPAEVVAEEAPVKRGRGRPRKVAV